MSENDVEKVPSEGRRRLLGTLAASGAAAILLPEKWTRPVLDRILVPAHAQQVSGFNFTGTYTNNGGPLLVGSDRPGGLFERLVDTIIPAAHANGNLVSCAEICIAVQAYSNGTAEYWITGARSNLVSYNQTTGIIQDTTVTGCSKSFSVTNARFDGPPNAFCTGTVSSTLSQCSPGVFTAPKVMTGIPASCGCVPPT